MSYIIYDGKFIPPQSSNFPLIVPILGDLGALVESALERGLGDVEVRWIRPAFTASSLEMKLLLLFFIPLFTIDKSDALALRLFLRGADLSAPGTSRLVVVLVWRPSDSSVPDFGPSVVMTRDICPEPSEGSVDSLDIFTYN